MALCAGPPSHPFTVHDMLAMQRISEPRASPDGTRVVFTVRTTDMEENKGRTSLWLVRDGRGRASAIDCRSGQRHRSSLVARRQDDLLPFHAIGNVAGVANSRRRRRSPAGNESAAGRDASLAFARRPAPGHHDGCLSRRRRGGHAAEARGSCEAKGHRARLRPDLRAALGRLERRPSQPPLRDARNGQGRGRWT